GAINGYAGRIQVRRAVTMLWAIQLGDVMDEQAASFYSYFEFMPLPGQPIRLLLPLNGFR
ncbi:MAG: hypothetical protein OEM98_12520, partial [Gammaproteobacteria bacterium]|nr:hypothetical protein [Gammaproteobacteria bacterium]